MILLFLYHFTCTSQVGNKVSDLICPADQENKEEKYYGCRMMTDYAEIADLDR